MHQDQSVSKLSIISEKIKIRLETARFSYIIRVISYYYSFCASEHTHTIQCIHMQY